MSRAQTPPRTLQYVPLSQVVPADRNPKDHALDDLRKSMARFGFLEPIVMDERTEKLIAGHGRLETLAAAQSAGMDMPEGLVVINGEWAVPIVRGWASANDDEASAALIAVNHLTELGGWSTEDLTAMLKELDAGPGLEGIGYTTTDLSDLLTELANNAPKPEKDPDAVPSVPKKPITKLGDVWILGPHRLVCGDSTSAKVLDTLLEGAKADMVWTDPPYGIDYAHLANQPRRGRKSGNYAVANDQLVGDAFESFLRATLGQALAYTRPGGTWFVAAPAGDAMRAFAIVLHEFGIWRQTLIWLKQSLVLIRQDYHYRHEMLFYGWAPGGAHKGPPTRDQDSIWVCDRPTRSDEHPTMKPVALIERAIQNHTRADAIILDIFGGSGSTLIAADRLSRRARLVELDRGYCDVICKRYEEHTGILPIRGSTGKPQTFL